MLKSPLFVKKEGQQSLLNGFSASYCLLLLLLLVSTLEAKLPDLDERSTKRKVEEIMQSHALYKQFDHSLAARSILSFIELLDPLKSYFTYDQLKPWLEPSEELKSEIVNQFKEQRFDLYHELFDQMGRAIETRATLDLALEERGLSTNPSSIDFRKIHWAADQTELKERLWQIRSLQQAAILKLDPSLQETTWKRLKKREQKLHDDYLAKDQVEREHFFFSYVIKAIASSLDSHTNYFTPDEAQQFMIDVQKRLFGIGAQLRDDLNGFTITQIIEGGPAYNGKKLKLKDRIIAVNGEPVVGMDIIDAVSLVRGEEGTEVQLAVIREQEIDAKIVEEKLDIPVIRGEIVIKEARYNVASEPFGDGSIGYIKLHAFYQDPKSSSTSDIAQEIRRMKEKENLKGVILDFRGNAGGLLSQAVGVSSLFIKKGIVVSIKDERDQLQHLRNVDGRTTWDGPLIILIDRTTASAPEIVAGTLQDYRRAIIVGDARSYGKGSFQTFTLNSIDTTAVNPEGEYKVSRGLYHTVSGRSPQLHGVAADIEVAGPFSQMEIGEETLKYPLMNSSIEPNFDDKLADLSFVQRETVGRLYRQNLQKPLQGFTSYLPQLKDNSARRMAQNKRYQRFLTEIRDTTKDDDEAVDERKEREEEEFDFQLQESLEIMKDLIYFKQLEN